MMLRSDHQYFLYLGDLGLYSSGHNLFSSLKVFIPSILSKAGISSDKSIPTALA